jgi:hypothetical protein
MKIADSLKRIFSILALANDLQVRESGEQGAQALARGPFVIYQQNTHQAFPPGLTGISRATWVMPAALRPKASRAVEP